MKKLPVLLNSLFTALLAGFAALLAARYWLPRTASIVVAGAAAGGLLIILLAVGLSKPENRARQSERDRELRRALLSMDAAARIHFLAQLFAFSGTVTEDEGGFTVCFEDREVYMADRLRFRPLSADDVTSAYYAARARGAEALILTDVPDAAAVETAAYLGVRIKGWARIRKLMDEYRAYPRIRRAPKAPRYRRIAGLALAKSRTKAYLLAALVLLTTSLVTPYSIYYLSGCIVCCILAAVTILRRAAPVQDW